MSKVVNGILIIEETPDGACELCGAVGELRPYGPKNENICYNCGVKDPETTERKMEEHLFRKIKPINPNLN